MNVLVTGATGFLGIRFSRMLAEKGIKVHALYRTRNKTKELVHKNIKLFKGEINDRDSLLNAAKACQAVFHLAAFAQVWSKDSSLFHRINYDGSEEVLKVALETGIQKIIIASTAGVFGPSDSGPIGENTIRKTPYFNEYDQTKAQMEEMAIEYAKNGMHIVIVNPTRIFGEGILSTSNGVSKLIKLYIDKGKAVVPGSGKSKGNYVHIDDVCRGMLLALEKGETGERYILGGENLSYNEFYRRLAQISGKTHKIHRLPLWLMLSASSIMLLLARISGKSPLITPPWVRRYNYNWELSSSKAEIKLGYSITPFDKALRETIDYLYPKGY